MIQRCLDIIASLKDLPFGGKSVLSGSIKRALGSDHIYLEYAVLENPSLRIVTIISHCPAVLFQSR